MGQSILAGNAKLFQKGFPASVATSCAFWVIPGRWGGGPPESAKHVCEGGHCSCGRARSWIRVLRQLVSAHWSLEPVSGLMK